MKHINAIELEALIQQQYSNITGLVILKGQQLVHEHYTGGYPKDSAVHVASVTKSVLSALIGIAIEQGAIHSIEQKVLDFFPRYRLKRGEKTIQQIKIRHLLTMTAPYKYQYEPYTKVYSSDDWTIAALDLLGGKHNLEAFKYTTVGIQVLAGVIANATNQSVRDFANKHLFKPLGINVSQDITINNKEEYFSFLKNNLVSGTVVDPKGVNTARWGLILTAMDMAKFGQLYLNNGLWQGKEILPSPWIKRVFKNIANGETAHMVIYGG